MTYWLGNLGCFVAGIVVAVLVGVLVLRRMCRGQDEHEREAAGRYWK